MRHGNSGVPFKKLGSTSIEGEGFMQPPYKDTVSGTRPYAKKQGYHGFKSVENKEEPVEPKEGDYKKYSDLEKHDNVKN